MSARFTVSAWVGAAVLFVVSGVREVRSPELSSTTKDLLVAIRFPPYYACGFLLVGIGFLASLLVLKQAEAGVRRSAVVAGLLGVALALMLADYFWILTPLLDMVTPPGEARPAEFLDYHRASEAINTVDLGLCLVAAVLLCWEGGGRMKDEGSGSGRF